MNVWAPFIANAQSAKLVQPCQGTLYYPPMDAQPAAMLCEALGKDRYDSKRAQHLSMRFRVVSTVSLNLLRPAPRTTSFSSNCGYGSYQWQQLSYIMTIGLSQDSCHWYSFGIRNHVMFTSWFAPVRRIGSCFFPRLQPLEWTHYPQWPVTNRSDQLLGVWQATVHEASATRLPLATPEDDANRSFQSRIPFPGATSPKERRSSKQTVYRSTIYDCPQAFGQGSVSSLAWEEAEAAQSIPTDHHQREVLPSVSPSHKEKLPSF